MIKAKLKHNKTKKMKKLAVIIIVIFSCQNLYAQINDSLKCTKIISIVPQYVFQNGFRVDYEISLKKNLQSWLQISPEFFINTDGNDISSYNYKNMSGFGLEIHHKYFMTEHNNRFGLYMAYGGGFQHFGITNTQQVNYSFSENGAEYISYKTADVTTPINRILLNFMVGKQIIKHKPFIIDYYMGVGFRYSLTKNMELIDTFNQTWFDYGYSGSLIVAGIKFGFCL